MKILITGGCGFLGSNIASKYLKLEEEVIIIDNLSREGSKKNLSWLKSISKSNNLHFYEIDIKRKEDVNSVFLKHSNIDYVCHLAGQVAMTKSIENPLRDFNTNALGTINVLEAIRNNHPNCFIAYSSTNKVYGDLEHLNKNENETRYFLPDFPNGLNENLPLDFSTPYGCSKGSADQYIKDYAKVFGLKSVVFRHSSIYGGRQFSSFDQGWVGWFCKQAIKQKEDFSNKKLPKPFTISGTGKQVRDLLHAEDLIRLYLEIYSKRENLKGDVFNIGGGVKNSLSLIELFRKLENFLEINSLSYNKQKRRKSDQDYFVADISKIRNLIRWEPKINVDSGLKLMIEWTYKLKQF